MIVDASVVVAALNTEDVLHQRAWQFLEAHQSAAQRLAAPSILLPEVASGLRRSVADPQLTYKALHALEVKGIIALFPVGSMLARLSAELSISLGIHGCDAVYVALAKLRGETLISFDRRQVERARGVIEAREP